MWRWILLLPTALLACGDDPARTPPETAPSGSLRIEWRVVGADGEPIDCLAAGFTTVSVAIGGAPREVACDAGSIVFTALLPDRYPVFATLKAGPVGVVEVLANAFVEAEQETVTELEFRVDSASSNSGAILIRWLVEGFPPSAGCGLLGAEKVRVSAGPSSVAPFSPVEVSCTSGQALVTGLRQGTYEVRVTLLDASDAVLTTSDIRQVAVLTGQQSRPFAVNLFLPGNQSARIRAEWTLSSSTASTACARVGGNQVRMRILALATVETATGCRAGALELGGLPTGEYDLEVALLGFRDPISQLEPVLTATILPALRVQRARTTTVSVDLAPRPSAD